MKILNFFKIFKSFFDSRLRMLSMSTHECDVAMSRVAFRRWEGAGAGRVSINLVALDGEPFSDFRPFSFRPDCSAGSRCHKFVRLQKGGAVTGGRCQPGPRLVSHSFLVYGSITFGWCYYYFIQKKNLTLLHKGVGGGGFEKSFF